MPAVNHIQCWRGQRRAGCALSRSSVRRAGSSCWVGGKVGLFMSLRKRALSACAECCRPRVLISFKRYGQFMTPYFVSARAGMRDPRQKSTVAPDEAASYDEALTAMESHFSVKNCKDSVTFCCYPRCAGSIPGWLPLNRGGSQASSRSVPDHRGPTKPFPLC